jgi:UDP-N-acetylmuramate: L-alanyl-gamma-D-glutamyl-meso-diaminopimelate ligase
MSDLALNRIPEKVKTIHLIAVCGTAMGALACLLKDLGFQISGSDQRVYPPMSDFLKAKGVTLLEGFQASHLDYGPDLVVVGNAVSKTNPEVMRMLELKLNYCSMPQAVGRFAAAGRRQVVITGTHGKTTTSSLIAWLLYSAGLDPSFMIGGILANFNSNYRLGNGRPIVIEGDEYDTAYFDKGPKFLHYQPDVAIVTSVEFDHADIFKDLDHVKQAFAALIARIPATSALLAYDQDPNVAELISKANCHRIGYGRCDSSDWRLGRATVDPPFTTFEVYRHQDLYGCFRTRMMGEHNLCNALAAIGAADQLGISPEALAKGLADFRGIKRRQETRGIKRGITVIDDFAHHPTAVQETIRAVKPFYPQGRLIAVFEPRTNSSMRSVFQSVYPRSFDHADLVCIRKPPLLEKIPENERFSSRQLVEDVRTLGQEAHYFEDTQAIIDFVAATAESGDVVLVMSNGGFDNIHERLLQAL